jgi:lipoprotein-anchoring transpeptidase ErfK/SrfK
MARLARIVAIFGACLALLGAEEDPGVEVRVDLERFELAATDLRAGGEPLVLRVATGTPAHPTPTGRFRPWVVVRNPAWRPGPTARARGAEAVEASEHTPMGVAKIPLDSEGFTLHGGADPLLLGKPVSLGCVRLADTDMLALLGWLERAGALSAARAAASGELHQSLRRRIAFVVR